MLLGPYGIRRMSSRYGSAGSFEFATLTQTGLMEFATLTLFVFLLG
jgi:hypothetical protein